MLNKNKIVFAKMNESVIIPSKNEENCGYDIYANFEEGEMIFAPHQTRLVPTKLKMAITKDNAFILKERGSTGSIGLKCGAGVIDSGYRGEIFVALTNENDKPLIISKNYKKTLVEENLIIYPYIKAIAQGLLIRVPAVEVEEISVEDLENIPSERGTGCLGSSMK